MATTLSIRTRLLGGLIVALTLVLAACGGGLYWLQRQLLVSEFDQRLERSMMHNLRELRRESPDSDDGDTSPPAVPEGLAFMGTWWTGQPRPNRLLPATIDLGEALAQAPVAGEGTQYQSLQLPDGRQVRLAVRRGLPMPMGRDAWRDRRREAQDRAQPSDDSPPRTPSDDRTSPPANGRTSPSGDRTPPPPPETLRDARPTYVIFAAADMAPLHAALSRWTLALLAGGAVAELMVVAVVLIAVARGLRPLKAMETSIAGIDDTDLAARLPATGLPAELRPLVGQLNKLLARMESAFQREREFTSNAAHEFMTPLAAIRTQIEVALRRPRGPEEYRDTLDRSLRTALSLQRLVEVLLDLSRLDRGQVTMHVQQLDVAELVNDEIERARPTAEVRQCTLKFHPPAEAPWNTDRQLIERIVGNLMANAAEYADPGTSIDVSLRVAETELELVVANKASSMSQSEVARMGDRFWRQDASRTDTTRHCGLGLSIVRRCVQALGGQLQISLEAESLRVSVRLPAIPSLVNE